MSEMISMISNSPKKVKLSSNSVVQFAKFSSELGYLAQHLRKTILSKSLSDILHRLGLRINPAILKSRSTAALLGSRVCLYECSGNLWVILERQQASWFWLHEFLNLFGYWTTCCLSSCGIHKAEKIIIIILCTAASAVVNWASLWLSAATFLDIVHNLPFHW